MRVAVAFQDERLDVEIPEDRLVGHWPGPAGVSAADARALVRAALEHPRQYPPLRQAVVPGDEVVIALDSEVPETQAVLEVVCEILGSAGVEPEGITVLSGPSPTIDLAGAIPPGARLVTHDPDDRSRLAYLATTGEGRRVYLNRLMTDADFVLPIGRLGYDAVLGYRGPWGTLFPSLSDQETARAYRVRASDERPDREKPWPALTESSEVSWLLGSQLQVGILPGMTGLIEVVAGSGPAVQGEGALAVDRAWGFRPESRAELVVVGIGRPGIPSRIEDLVEGLATGARLVQRGGKIIALSRTRGTFGPALQRLSATDDPRIGPAALRGHEADPDYVQARALARTLAWADVYVLSALAEDDVDGLSMIALERPEEARRLAAQAGSCFFVSCAEWTRADVVAET